MDPAHSVGTTQILIKSQIFCRGQALIRDKITFIRVWNRVVVCSRSADVHGT